MGWTFVQAQQYINNAIVRYSDNKDRIFSSALVSLSYKFLSLLASESLHTQALQST